VAGPLSDRFAAEATLPVGAGVLVAVTCAAPGSRQVRALVATDREHRAQRVNPYKRTGKY